jgi:multicomponent Na+:H+ antiporter subunit A
LTIGFFKDELFFAAAVGRGNWLAVAATLSAALTFAYLGRFWAGVFLGPVRREVRDVPRRLVVPVLALGVLVLVGGVLVQPFATLAANAAEVAAAEAVDLEPAYHLDLRAENVMALAAYSLGLSLLAVRSALGGVLRAVRRMGERIGPEQLYVAGLSALNQLSTAIHDIEVRDLRGRLVAVLVPAGVLVAVGVAATPFDGSYRLGSFTLGDLPLVTALLSAVCAALITTWQRRHLSLILALSGVGFSLAVAYELLGAPDVALVAVLIETLFMLLFVGVFARLPADALRREAELPVTRSRRIRDPIVGVVSGIVVALIVWGGLSRPVPPRASADEQTRLVEEAHGRDVVTVILADFRGLDTLVEITVILVALLAVAALLRRGRLW